MCASVRFLLALPESPPAPLIQELLIRKAREMREAFELASKKYGSPDDIAQHREDIVRIFLKEYLPKDYSLGKGEIIDTYGKRSNQVDVVICNQWHPFTISDTGRGIFFAEGVSFAVEVKSRLDDREELKRAIEQVRSVKRLRRNLPDGAVFIGNDYDKDRLDRIPCVVFAFGSLTLSHLKSRLEEMHKELSVAPEEALDAVVVHDVGMLVNVRDERDPLMITKGSERRLGLSGLELGERTAMNFLWYLSLFPQYSLISRPLISSYLKFLERQEVKVV